MVGEKGRETCNLCVQAIQFVCNSDVIMEKQSWELKHCLLIASCPSLRLCQDV